MSDKLLQLAWQVWNDEPGVAASVARALATPAAALFRAGVAARNTLYSKGVLPGERAAVPVISVGNLRIGGSGKTPVAAWLLTQLLARGRRPALLHGGYAADEPQLHARWHPDVPVFAARDRVASAKQAVSGGADVLVLDDGFQHRRLARDLDVVLVAAEDADNAMRLLPRGPWREPATALGRAHVLMITRKSASVEQAERLMARLAPVAGDAITNVGVWLRPAGWRNGAGLSGPPTEVLVVAAIARPEPFLENVRQTGVRVLDSLWFRDHHEFDARDAERILRAAGPHAIATTAKDAIKLEKLIARERLYVLEQEVVVERGEPDLLRRLDEVLG